VELRQLEYFRAICRLNNITKAAHEMRVAQPSVTAAIKKLEHEFGVQLLARGKKQVTPTHEGRIFLRRANDILARVEDTVREINDCRRLDRGSIKIGITPIMGSFLFPFAFTNFRKIYPNVDIAVIEEGSLAIHSQLEQGELDLGILVTSNVSPNLETVPIINGQLLVCMSRDHSLSNYSIVPFEKLREHPFILFREDTYSRRLVLEECARHDFSPNVLFSTSQIETILNLVKQGDGISFLLETIVRLHPDILGLPLAEPLFIEAGLAWNKERYLSKAAKLFVDLFSYNPLSG
jgi:DNA-binding transcriptional LysR family regulator